VRSQAVQLYANSYHVFPAPAMGRLIAREDAARALNVS
jgi:hypothetical protein